MGPASPSENSIKKLCTMRKIQTRQVLNFIIKSLCHVIVQSFSEIFPDPLWGSLLFFHCETHMFRC